VISEKLWRVALGIGTLLIPSLVLNALIWPDSLYAYRAIVAHPPVEYVTPTLGGILRTLTQNRLPWIQFVIPLLTAFGLLAYLWRVRRSVQWQETLGPLLLLSVCTAPYGWIFDEVVLLIPFLQVVGWVAARRIEGRGRRAAVVAALLLISSLILFQNILKQTDEFIAWAPWAFGAVYWYAHLIRQPGRAAAHPEPRLTTVQ
jgi:hypothetical protein